MRKITITRKQIDYFIGRLIVNLIIIGIIFGLVGFVLSMGSFMLNSLGSI